MGRDIIKSLRHVTVKECISNPFIGKDKNNNMDIHIYTLLKHYSKTQGSIDYFYSMALESRKNPECKKYILGLFRKDLKYEYSSMDIRLLLTKRMVYLMDLYKISNKLDDYNSLNNKRLSDKSLQRITIETKELEQILRNLNNLSLVSTEAITVMSAFYTNRLAKIWPIFARIKFILDKKDVIKKVYENPDLKYEDFEFTEDEIKLYMAQYDTLQQILEDKYVSKLTDSEIYKIETDDQTREKARKMYSAALSEYAVKYQELYSSFEQDSKNVSINCEAARKFYIMKHDSIKSLIYAALTDKDQNIINWGYIPCDENNQKNRVLIGFDIKYLNMPAFFHIKESDLKRIVKEATGDTKIPVYEGAIDMHYFFGKRRITTLVLYPVTKNIRKNLKVNPKDKVKTLLKHLIWLQKPKERPDFISEPGSKLYDLSTKEIIKKRKNKSEQDDPEF